MTDVDTARRARDLRRQGMGAAQVAAMILDEVGLSPGELVVVAQEALGRAIAVTYKGQPVCRWCRHPQKCHSSFSSGRGRPMASCSPPADKVVLTKAGGFKIIHAAGACHCRAFSESVHQRRVDTGRNVARAHFQAERSLAWIARMLHTSVAQVVEWTADMPANTTPESLERQ